VRLDADDLALHDFPSFRAEIPGTGLELGSACNRGRPTVREAAGRMRLGCLRLGDRDGRKVDRRLHRVVDEVGQQQLRRQRDDLNDVLRRTSRLSARLRTPRRRPYQRFRSGAWQT
jgi:hypothetical protein